MEVMEVREAIDEATDGGALEAEDGLYVDADAAVHAPRNVNVGGALDVKSDAFVGGSVVVGGTVMGSGAYIDSSDARFKRDLAVLDGAACLGALLGQSLPELKSEALRVAAIATRMAREAAPAVDGQRCVIVLVREQDAKRKHSRAAALRRPQCQTRRSGSPVGP